MSVLVSSLTLAPSVCPVRLARETTPTLSLMPQRSTMFMAMFVACSKSLLAPDVTLSFPKMSSSATRPPMHTSIFASIWRRLQLVSSFSGSCITMPSDMPRGTTVALCTGRASGVKEATMACPPSWYAVSLTPSSVTTALLRSAPIMILSFANSKSASPTVLLLSVLALMAAMLTTLDRSAPENPGVPRATISTSTPGSSGTFLR
mmetsp:Transcript_29592/g.57913  ORF Transcript_29592/g.57913 Transcript_29592/m.57913 type:complete len:205 (+) Transcript_29592:235-849(+)